MGPEVGGGGGGYKLEGWRVGLINGILRDYIGA